jgi:hypothetical protein
MVRNKAAAVRKREQSKTISLKKKYNFFSRSNFTRGKGRVSDFLGHEDAHFFFFDVFFFDKSSFCQAVGA